MLAPQDISIFLNNALKPTHYQAELDAETPLPESIREMPDQVSGHLIDLDAPAGSKNSLGEESVRDGRPATDDSTIEAMDEETPVTPALPDR